MQKQEAEDIPAIGAECEVEEDSNIISDETEVLASPLVTSVSTQTDIMTGPIGTAIAGSARPTMSVANFQTDLDGIHNFTGLENYAKFQFVLNTLGPAAYHLKYVHGALPKHISIEDAFFIVLIRLRKHYTLFDISRMFGITETDASNIFCTWIRFMSLQWREVPWWPSRSLVQFYAPDDFKTKFQTTRVIIDGTECPIKKPKLPTAQQSTFSTYKNRNTVKVLAGISPGGLTSYVSPAYGGSTSDRQIIERSRVPQLCDTGDSVMADKGFNVQDIFAPYNVTVNIPTFFKKKNRMGGKSVLHDRKIASKRVHVERIIGLAKTYKILTVPLNISETQLASDIIYVCFVLCNFRAGIIPKHC